VELWTQTEKVTRFQLFATIYLKIGAVDGEGINLEEISSASLFHNVRERLSRWVNPVDKSEVFPDTECSPRQKGTLSTLVNRGAIRRG